MLTDPLPNDSPSSDSERRLFDEALDFPAGPARDAWLAGACRGDDVLRSRILALLHAHEEESQFLPTVIIPPSERSSEETGERIGPYKLLQEIGEGGFGTVWMADQEQPVRRRVALKIIKLGMDTKEVVARFEQERQALAMMDHPNIARVFDAGATEQGRPFFVMELVRGMKITDYCDEKGLSTTERVELFILVCQAVQHAHQKGIIHRDLKPSNILVTVNDGKAVPKVIDFGVAKATQGKLADGTLFTQFEQMIGTPLYMSPEQAEMTSVDVDTRSDIYSLGVLLYELLTGRTPIDMATFAKAGIGEIRRIIREVDPVRPSARLKTLDGNTLSTTAKRRHTDPAKLPGTLRGDIDWIVMKCIEKDRGRRYDTANGLALDLQRHLANEVVIARPPTAGYLLSKLIKRHKLAFAAGTAIAASLVIGIAASVWQAYRATRAEKAAIAGEQRATAAFDELRATAPAFAEQARGLAAKEQYADAIAKLDYAIKLRPDAAEFLVAKGDLLQCQLQLAPAAAIYREALRVQPGHARAEASATLCEELLAAQPAADGKLSRESLAKLHVAMQKQQRPAAELLPVARLLGEEKKLLLDYCLARLKDLPVSAEHPLAKRLTVREDGRLALDLSGTKVTDLSPLAGAPLAALDLNGSTDLTDLSPLAGLALIELQLDSTGVTDLTPLREMHSLETLTVNETQVADLAPLSALRLKILYLQGTPVTDLTPLQKMPLETLLLRGTRVTDLSPLIGMPIKNLWLDQTPVRDFSPLARMPLENCYLSGTPITDLTVLRGTPLKELALSGCTQAHNYAALTEILTLESLRLPDTFRSLPDEDLAAIGALRLHPKLRQIQADDDGTRYYSAIQSKDLFWQDWDRLQTFLPALRKSGFRFDLTKQPDGTYWLYIRGEPVSDLSFLKGAPISKLDVPGNKITDLTPLRGMPLKFLNVDWTLIADLSALRGMPLENLCLAGTRVSDLSPLAGMPLKTLVLRYCNNVTDISPLLEVPTLERVQLPTAARNIELLRKMPNLKTLDFKNVRDDWNNSASTVADFWKQWDTLTWMRALQATGIAHTATEITEETPQGNKGTGMWSIRITSKDFRDCSIFKGAANIQEMNLAGSAVTDLAPLADCKGLQSLILPQNPKDIEFLRTSTRLQRISYREDPKTKQPAQTAAEFWKEYDSQGWLRALRASGLAINSAKQLEDGTWDVDLEGSKITDLTILKGAPISRLRLSKTAVSDLTALRGCPLQQLLINVTRVADLAPLRGLPLHYLAANGTAVADLEPLRGMAIKELALHGTKVTDLRPLQGMPLEKLNLKATKVTDLSALRGMPLTKVEFLNCPDLTDLSPLAETKGLTFLILPPNAKGIEFLRTFPKLERIGFKEHPTSGFLPDQTAAEFWKEWDAKKK